MQNTHMRGGTHTHTNQNLHTHRDAPRVPFPSRFDLSFSLRHDATRRTEIGNEEKFYRGEGEGPRGAGGGSLGRGNVARVLDPLSLSLSRYSTHVSKNICLVCRDS